MTDMDQLLTVLLPMFLPLTGVIIVYALRNESRLSRLEAKLDIVLHHLGLNPDKEKRDEPHHTHTS